MEINQEILGGLRTALERGQSLKRAILSFTNAGYSQKEIDEAAQALQSIGFEQQVQVQQLQRKEMKKARHMQASAQAVQQPMQYQQQIYQPAYQPVYQQQPMQMQYQPNQQRVSSYFQSPQKMNLLIIALVVFLFLLLGALITIFLFREELMALFSDIF